MGRYLRIIALFIIACNAGSAHARNCPAGALSTPKSSTLYLYYPAALDSTYWNVQTIHYNTGPLPAFDLNNLDPSIGTEADLRGRVQQMVETAICEFDVRVRTITARAPTGPRWQIVGLGSDQSNPIPAHQGMGRAEHEDIGDAGAQDFARIWLRDYADWLGPELQGTNATLERWATAIANVALHEVGHNYGTTHFDATPRSGEDAVGNHFMASIGTGATQQSVAAGLNHYSDRSYEALAHSIGLNARTVSNWDFVNPNSDSAENLQITILSAAPGLTVGWHYLGIMSPWENVDVVPGGPVQFRGMTLNSYLLVFWGPRAQPWANGPAGIVPGGAAFHVGASFLESDPIFITDARLSGPAGDLTLHPRIVDFAGHTGFRPGPGSLPGFELAFSNPSGNALLLRDLDVQFSPRMIDIETMMPNVVARGMDERPAALYAREPRRGDGIMTRAQLRRQVFRLGREPIRIPIAALTDPRHLMVDYPRGRCDEHRGPGGEPAAPVRGGNDAVRCPGGTALSLFPATYVYVSATLVDPAARHWDRRQRRMVTGPLETRLFFQLAGTVPDANRNGIDDLLDIRSRRSADRNADGVPDEARAGR